MITDNLFLGLCIRTRKNRYIYYIRLSENMISHLLGVENRFRNIPFSISNWFLNDESQSNFNRIVFDDVEMR